MVKYSKVTIVITDNSGDNRRYVPSKAFGAGSAAIEQYGGYGEFNQPMSVATTDLPSIQTHDRIEWWAGDFGTGRRLYRGYIEDRDRQRENVDRLLLRGYGRMFALAGIYCDTVYPVPTDVVTIAQDIMSRVLQPEMADVFFDLLLSTPTLSGIISDYFDARGKTAQQALSDLCDLTGGTWHWGFYVNDIGGSGYPAACDAMFFRASGTRPGVILPHSIAITGDDAIAWTAAKQGSQVKNRLRLAGGIQDFPNHLTNGNFSKLLRGKDRLEANLIANPSFELGGAANGTTSTSWTLGGGAAIKQRGQTSPTELDPHSGNFQLETSASGEYAEQVRTVNLVEGHIYKISLWTMLQVGSSGAGGVVKFYFAVSGSGYVLAGTTTITGSSEWLRTETGGYAAPANVNGIKIRFEHGSVTGDFYWEDVTLWDDSVPVQEGWMVATNVDYYTGYPLPVSGDGTARVTDLDYQASGALVGAYCTSITISQLTDDDNNDVVICPIAPLPVIAGQVWVQGLYLQPPAGTVKAYSSVRWLKADFSLVSEVHGYDTIDSGSATYAHWNGFFNRYVVPTDAVWALPMCRMRSTGIWRFDKFTWLNELTPDADGKWIADGNLYFEFAAEESTLSSLVTDSEVLASYGVYGVRVGSETADSIVTYEQAKIFAGSYFNNNGKQRYQPTVTLGGMDRDIFAGDTVNLQGAIGPVLSGNQILPVAKMTYQQNTEGFVSCVLENGKRLFTLEAMMRLASKDELKRKR